MYMYHNVAQERVLVVAALRRVARLPVAHVVGAGLLVGLRRLAHAGHGVGRPSVVRVRVRERVKPWRGGRRVSRDSQRLERLAIWRNCIGDAYYVEFRRIPTNGRVGGLSV